MKRRRYSLVIVSGIVLFSVVVFGPSAAGAHAYLVSEDPNQSSVILSAPRQVVLHFDEPVEIDFGAVAVFGPSGERQDEGGAHHLADDSHSIAVLLTGHLTDGTYVVAWHVISADSHPVHGAYVFSIGEAGGVKRSQTLAGALDSARGSGAVGVVFGFIRFGLFTGLLILVGLAALVVLIARQTAANRRIRRILWGSWIVVFVCSLGGVAVQGVYASSLPLARVLSPSLFDEVLHTRFGEVQLLRVALLVGGLPILLRTEQRLGDRSTRRWTVWGALVGLGLVLTPGLSGHASTTGNPIFGLALDVTHLTAAALWIGGLVLLCALFLPGAPDVADSSERLRIAKRFSTFALGSVAVVAASGFVQSLRQVGSFYALFDTVYGRTLVVKICLVIALVALGALSRRLVVGRWFAARYERHEPSYAEASAGPARVAASGWSYVEGGSRSAVVQLERNESVDFVDPVRTAPPSGPSALRRSTLAELLVACAVLVATSLLVNATPARQAASQPYSKSFEVLGVQVNAIIDPARVGSGNQFHFYILGGAGQPLGIAEFDAAISLPSKGIGPISLPLTLGGPGHYLDANFDIPFAGTWDLRLTVRTSPVDEHEVSASFPVH